jgi:hypothetical protein
MVSGRHGRPHEAVTAATREEAAHPLIIVAIATDQVRAMHEHAAALQRAAESRRKRAAGPRRWLSWPGLRRGPASGRSISALSAYRSAISVRAPR